MTVRWKPLLILSGVFAVIALLGVTAMAWTLWPQNDPAALLEQAHQEIAQGRFEEAHIYTQKAEQIAPDDPRIDLAQADLYAAWADQPGQDPAQRRSLRTRERAALTLAARGDKRQIDARTRLLVEALDRGALAEAQAWAQELLGLDPGQTDAHFASAAFELIQLQPARETLRSHAEVLQEREPQRPRTAWVLAELDRISQRTEQRAERIAAFVEKRPEDYPDPTDRLGLFQLQTAHLVDDGLEQADSHLLEPVLAQAEALMVLEDGPADPERIRSVADQLETVQDRLQASGHDALVEAVETMLEETFDEVFTLSAELAEALDIPLQFDLHVGYATHLLARQRHGDCADFVQKTLEHPDAEQPDAREATRRLRELAIRAVLAQQDDPERFDRVQPWIDRLVESSNPIDQALGHLFHGVIALERSGHVQGSGSAMTGADRTKDHATRSSEQARLRGEAREHLRKAAQGLPELSTAQALYGIALILNDEQDLGREYLLRAGDGPGLEPRYQIWVAWSFLRAGYPEEAEAVVRNLRVAAQRDPALAPLLPTLDILQGEIYQARPTSEDRQLALASYQRAIEAGYQITPTLEVRRAQLEIAQGNEIDGIRRLIALRKQVGPRPDIDYLATVTYDRVGQTEQARDTLEQARRRFPDDQSLVQLEASFLIRDDQVQDADTLLAEFLEDKPEAVDVALMRAGLLAEQFDDLEGAEEVLLEIAGRTNNSAPQVRLAGLQIAREAFDEAAETIAEIRERWDDPAVADLLEAQRAIQQGRNQPALGHLETALQKDPSNKVAQYYRAVLQRQMGVTDQAEATLQGLAQSNTIKDLDPGLSLKQAAEISLAQIALDRGEPDEAVVRLQQVLDGTLNPERTKPIRWRLVSALERAGRWDQARAEIDRILEAVDAQTSPDPSTEADGPIDDYVRAASFYRQHGQTDEALQLLEQALAVEPTDEAAAVTRATLLADQGQLDQARAGLRQTLERVEQESQTPGPNLYLVLAALEAMPEAEAPDPDRIDRARSVIEDGLAVHGAQIDLVEARFRLTQMAVDIDSAIAELIEASRTTNEPELRQRLATKLMALGRFDEAQPYLEDWIEAEPDQATPIVLSIQCLAGQAIRAAQQGREADRRRLEDQVARRIEAERERFPDEPRLLQAACELEARRGDLTRALDLTRQIDQLRPHSELGPVLRAQLYLGRGQIDSAHQAYREAVRRQPGRIDLRVALSRTALRAGQTDEALLEVERVLQRQPERPDAVLLAAEILSEMPGRTDRETKQRRQRAVELLGAAIERDPEFGPAYRQWARIAEPAEAVAVLERALATNPEDVEALSMLIETLARDDERLDRADQIAEEWTDSDDTGQRNLAVGVGFYRAGRLQRALPFTRYAAEVRDSARVALNYGDLLLALAEQTHDRPDMSERYLREAVTQYDRVLRQQATSVEAINNKAWILHHHFDEHREAKDLIGDLIARVDQETLPPEVFDTQGSIFEALGQTAQAEQAYRQGLIRDPEHPVLNFHLGRVIAADPKRVNTAGRFLQEAQRGEDRLTPQMIDELDRLRQRIER